MNQEINSSNVSIDTHSKVIPLKKFALYNICSLGIYQLYWIYKSWKNIKEYRKIDISPILRTIFSVFFVASLAKDTLSMAKDKGYTKNYSYVIVYMLFILLNFAGKKLPDFLGFIVAISSFVVFIPVVQASNYFWQKEEPLLKVNDKFSISSILLLIIGGLIVFFSLIGSLLPDDIEVKETVQLQDDNE